MVGTWRGGQAGPTVLLFSQIEKVKCLWGVPLRVRDETDETNTKERTTNATSTAGEINVEQQEKAP